MFGFLKKTPLVGEEVTLKIVGMHCTSCALTIDDALEEKEGVITASTSYAAAQVKVRFDPKVVSIHQLKQVIAELGYSVANKPK